MPCRSASDADAGTGTGPSRRGLLAWGGTLLIPAAPAAAAAGAGPVGATDTAGLPPALRALLTGSGLPLGSMGLQVQAVAGSTPPLASLNPERAYQLASTAKLVTTLAAFDLLGRGYCWRTRAFLDGPLNAGRLFGDLVIVGGGDARLSSAELRQWFGRLREQGLHEVLGDIVLDRNAFRLTDQDLATTPVPSPEHPHHAWPTALTLDDGRVRLGSLPGPPALADARSVPRLGQSRPARTAAAHADDGRLDLAVAQLWRASGGRLRGRVRERRPDDGDALQPRRADGQPLPVWSEHRSPPLPELVREINKTSDNLAARNLMLSMAPGFLQRPATLPAARERLSIWLRRQGLMAGDIAVDSGCGLSREERGKPRAMVQLLRRAFAGPQAQEFIQSLPVAGIDGTLAHRMTRGQATGRAFLKTGTLLDTRALAGYVHGRGTIYAVVALVNHPEAQRATPMLDAMVEWVAANG